MNVNLVLQKKDGVHKDFPLPNTVTVIGRQQECDLCVPLMIVSRRHCQLNQDDDKLTIRDLGSRNGTYLNGERIEEANLSAGDSIKIGPLVFVVQVDGQPDIESMVQPEIEEETAETATQKLSGDDLESFGDLDDFDDLDDLNDLMDLDGESDNTLGQSGLMDQI